MGDFLCSPAHYFRLAARERDVLIIGGGAFRELGLKQAARSRLGFDQTVLWGVGQSLADGEEPGKPLATLPYAAWSLRDVDKVADRTSFVPCVSCMHEMLDAPAQGTETIVFLNAARAASGFTQDDLEALRSTGLRILYNDCSPQQFEAALRASANVITNSFHGAYWSLLAGREVACFGYSSKFASLFAALGLDPSSVRHYRRDDTASLAKGIRELEKRDFVRLDNPEGTKRDFRELNIAFAERIRNIGLLSQFDMDQQNMSKNLAIYRRISKHRNMVKSFIMRNGINYDRT